MKTKRTLIGKNVFFVKYNVEGGLQPCFPLGAPLLTYNFQQDSHECFVHFEGVLMRVEKAEWQSTITSANCSPSN